MLTKLSVRLTPTLCGLTPKNKLVALLLTWTCWAWKANDEQYWSYSKCCQFMFECFSGLQVQLPNAQFRRTSHSVWIEGDVTMLLELVTVCLSWFSVFMPSCSYSPIATAQVKEVPKISLHDHKWQEVLLTFSGLTITLLAEIPHACDFFRFFARNTSPSC